jgi:hypothetical protein
MVSQRESLQGSAPRMVRCRRHCWFSGKMALEGKRRASLRAAGQGESKRPRDGTSINKVTGGTPGSAQFERGELGPYR